MDYPTDPLDPYKRALGQIESGNDYSQKGPFTKSGDRGYGRWQVMGANVPSWTQAATGQALTPEQFLKDKGAQDAVFGLHFGNSLQKYGNPQDAASEWFSGKPLAYAGNASDGYNTVPQYVNKFNKALASTGTPMADPNTQPALSPAAIAGPGGMYRMPAESFGDTMQNVAAWLSMPSNPQGGAAALQAMGQKRRGEQEMALANRPQLIPAGADPVSGRMRFVTWDPASGRMGSPQTMGAAPGGASSSPTSTDYVPDQDALTAAMSKHKSGELNDEGLMKAAGPWVGGYAQAMVKGDADPRFLGPRAQAVRTPAIMLAHELDPNFNENAIPARQAVVKSLSSKANGTFGGTVNRAQTAIQHMDQLQQVSDELGKLQPFQGANNVANYAANTGEGLGNNSRYKSLLGAYNSTAQFLAGEITNMASGGHAAYADREGVLKTLDASKSPAERRAAIGSLVGIMNGGVDPLVNGYNEAFGLAGTPKERTRESFYSKEANEALARVNGATNLPALLSPQGPNAAAAPQRPPLSSFQR